MGKGDDEARLHVPLHRPRQGVLLAPLPNGDDRHDGRSGASRVARALRTNLRTAERRHDMGEDYQPFAIWFVTDGAYWWSADPFYPSVLAGEPVAERGLQ